MSSTLSSNFFSQLATKEGATLCGAGLLFGGGSLWLLKLSTSLKAFSKITPDTKKCLQQSVGYAGLSWVLGLTPVFILRRLGWDRIQYFYSEVLFRNPMTTVLSALLPILMAAVAVLFPKHLKNNKHQLLVASSVSAGVILGPAFLQKRPFVTVAGGYTAGLILPIAASIALAPNFLTLNIASILGMAAGTVFMNKWGIPAVLEYNGVSETRRLIAGGLSNMMTSAVLSCAFFLLATVNAHVLYIQNCHMNQETEQNEKKKPWYTLDGTDPIANGIIMAGYTGFTFYRLLNAAFRLVKQITTKSPEGKDKKGFAEQLLDM